MQTQNRTATSRRPADCLVLGKVQVRLKHGHKSPLFVLIVQQNHRNHTQRLAAGPASTFLRFQVLDESVGEVVLGPRPSRRLGAARSALWTREFNPVIQGITVDCRAPSKPYSYSFNGPMHGVSPRSCLCFCALTALDAGCPRYVSNPPQFFKPCLYSKLLTFRDSAQWKS